MRIANSNILLNLCKYLHERTVEALERQKHNATGSLAQSIEVRLRHDSIEGLGLVHGAYLDHGAKPGRWVPIAALEEWARNKRLSLKPKQTYRDVAFAIQKHIHKNGIPSQPYKEWTAGNSITRRQWLTNMISREYQYIFAEIEKAFGYEITTEIGTKLIQISSR